MEKRELQHMTADNGQVFYIENGTLKMVRTMSEFRVVLAMEKLFTIELDGNVYHNPLKNHERIQELISKIENIDERIALMMKYAQMVINAQKGGAE